MSTLKLEALVEVESTYPQRGNTANFKFTGDTKLAYRAFKLNNYLFAK